MVLHEYKEKVDKIKKYICDNEDIELKKMLTYSLDGGKRLRSIIALYIFENFNKKYDNIVIAIELLHTASLILDDLPCMDNDSYRRNK